MNVWNVVMTAPALAPEAVALLEASGATIHYLPPYPDADAVAALVGAVQADAILCRQGRVTGAVMDASRRLRIVARHGVGVDEVDIEAAMARGLLVTRATGSNARAVAEHTLAMILALAKELAPLPAPRAAGGWRTATMRVRDIAGLRLGLVGFGAIGQEVARLAQGFGMRIAVHTRVRPEALPAIPPGGAQMVDNVAALAAGSDVLSLHCPLTPQTRHRIAATVLAAMPRGGFLVNTARGGLIDEVALLAALESGRLAGAALDGFEAEPPPEAYALRAHPRLIVTPHVAGVTDRALVAMGVMAAECIAAVLAGRRPPADRIVCG